MALLNEPGVLAARQAMLDRPAMAGLRAFAASIRAVHGPTPDFDPADGGGAARLLVLLETPGTAIGKTGFVSADNPTGTAGNLRRFFAQAGLHRQDIVIWNTVPFVIHTGGPNRAPRVAEIRRGLALVPALLPLLPNLCCAVLSGRIAAMAEPLIRTARPEVGVIRVPHPSPVYLCTNPDIPARLLAGFRAASHLLQAAGSCAMHNFPCNAPESELS